MLRVHPKTGRVTIEGVNIVKRHRRATQTSESGIVEFPSADSPFEGDAPRSEERRADPDPAAQDADGTVERIAVKSDQSIPRNR